MPNRRLAGCREGDRAAGAASRGVTPPWNLTTQKRAMIFIMCRRTLSSMFLASVLLVAATAQAQTTWFVDDDAPGGGDGLTWPTAFTYLQNALAAAAAGDQINVAGGTYVPLELTDPNDPRSATIHLISNVAIYGGYAGFADPNAPDTRDLSLYESTLSGDLDSNDDPNDPNSSNENSYHVVIGSNTDRTAILNGFTVTAGYGNDGGGMFNENCSPTVSNCLFVGNRAFNGGGGMSNVNSHPEVIDCTFSANVANGDGGGMSNTSNSFPELVNCAFDLNTAGGEGGGMFNYYGSPTLTDCTFTGNSASGAGYWCGGGGMYNRTHSNPSLINCSFIGNTAACGGGMGSRDACSPMLIGCMFIGNSGGSGGAMRNTDGCAARLTDCMFSDNSADAYGGGIYNNNSSPILINCGLSGNTAPVAGGAISNINPGAAPLLINCSFSGNTSGSGGIYNDYNSAPTVINCIFSGNTSSGSGGAIFNGQGLPLIINSTFCGNVANGEGGGMRSVNTETGENGATVINSVFWGNVDDFDGDAGGPYMDETAQIADGVHPNSWPSDVDYSLIQGLDTFSSGTGNIDSDPLFQTASSGAWTDDAIYDPAAGQTSFHAIAGGWSENVLAGRVLNPDTSQPLEAIIASNTATTVVALGDFAWLGAADVPYEVKDYRLSGASPCIDAADSTAVPADTYDLDGDGDTTERIPLDHDGGDRFADRLGTPDTGPDPNDPNLPVIDMGADEHPWDCNENGIPDTCDLDCGFQDCVSYPDCGQNEDCNGNGVPDECELAGNDCNSNGIPDDCEPDEDCNTNGIQDICDVAAGTSEDCNTNRIPDECEPDCDGDDIPDECEIANCDPNDPNCADCNGNGIPDFCDIRDCAPNDWDCADCNGNRIPDGCELDPNYAGVVVSRWIGGVDNWNWTCTPPIDPNDPNCPPHWCPDAIPNNAGGQTFNVFVDDADAVSVVTLDLSPTIAELTLSAADPNRAVIVVNDASGAAVRSLFVTDSPGIVNSGTLQATDGKRFLLDTPRIDQIGGGVLLATDGSVDPNDPNDVSVLQINGALVEGGIARTVGCNSSIELIGGAEFLDVTIETDCQQMSQSVWVPDAQSGQVGGLITNQGGIRVYAQSASTTLIPGAGNVTMIGGGSVVLTKQNLASFGWFGRTITNGDPNDPNIPCHWIEGAGLLFGGLQNTAGGIVEANRTGETLLISEPGQKLNNGLFRATAGGILDIQSDMFGAGALVAADNGEVWIYDVLVQNHSLTATGGDFVLGNCVLDLSDGVDLPPPAAPYNPGMLTLNSSMLYGTDWLTVGDGIVTLTNGSAISIAAGPVVLCPADPNAVAALNLTGADCSVACVDLQLCAGGVLDVAGAISLTGSLTFANVIEGEWFWSSSAVLEMYGGVGAADYDPNDYVQLEIGGRDLGDDPNNHTGDPNGFADNFDLPELVIGPDAHVNLADAVDNGNRNGSGGPAEALYVDRLRFTDTDGRLVLNGFHLYYNTLNGDQSQILDSMPLLGDLDGDCDVDLSDLARLLAGYGMTSGATYADGDLDGDGDVDLADLAALLGNYGAVCD